jgi:chemotaxis protein methyltransferase CheR
MLKIWSAASSSGEEAYTTAILCEEHKEKKPSFQYKIFGTDISTKAMRAAQAGIYGERSVDLFKKKYPLLLNKYMLIEKDSYKAGDRIKANVSFTKHNLFQGLPAEEKFDLVFLRNVLIYFSPQDQERVLSVIEKNIHNGGILILGESETIRDLKQNFWHKSVLIYEKKGEGV